MTYNLIKKFTISALVATLTFSLAGLPVAEAKRMGGGSSLGKRSSVINRQAPAPAPTAPAPRQAAPTAAPANTAATNAAAASNRSRWLGPVAGIAAGLGLAALFSSLGLGDELASMLGSFLMIALAVVVVMFIWRLLRGKARGSAAGATPQPAYAGRMMGPNTLDNLGNESKVNPLPSAPVRFEAGLPQSSVLNAPVAPNNIPSDFDTEAFLRNAKVYFVRLQAAWDAGNLNDIRDFTTPEMFAEIKMQIDERGAAPNQTDVVTLNAQLLGVETVAGDYLASVHFSGMIREEQGAAAQAFDEVWNLSKPVSGNSGWVLAGIQQVTAAQ